MADANGEHFSEELGKFYCSTTRQAFAKHHGIFPCAKCDNFRLYLASKPNSVNPDDWAMWKEISLPSTQFGCWCWGCNTQKISISRSSENVAATHPGLLFSKIHVLPPITASKTNQTNQKVNWKRTRSRHPFYSAAKRKSKDQYPQLTNMTTNNTATEKLRFLEETRSNLRCTCMPGSNLIEAKGKHT